MADEGAIPATDEKVSEPSEEARPDAFVRYWIEQVKAYDDEFKEWETRCKKIIRRYRDERGENPNGVASVGARFNALWANVQTLMPAIYIKPPQPVVERRYLDKDQLGRYASMTLERGLEVQIEVGYQHTSAQKAVLDYLLVGRGTLWERYEPKYGDPEDLGEQPEADLSTDAKKDAGEAPRPVTYEKVCTDYIAWDKFKHSPSAQWEDVWWVAKEELLTRQELRARFKGNYQGKPIADLIPLRDGGKDKENDREKKRRNPRACVYEIWNKREKEVIFIAPDWENAPLERTADPLGLEGFWPCPAPLYATLTNDCLVPVPDYVEYQDQARELDDLTSRITALTDAIRVNGVYDASYPELKRILSEGADNRMIGVKNYAEFASKGGLEKALDFVPIKDVVEALIRLYEARERVKADMAEITGLSDIVRGQAQGTAKTATEQRIKGQFASLRLEDRKKEIARFLRDDLRIKAEIISEQFDPEILAEMTGMVMFIAQELAATMPPAPPQPPSPMMGHNGGPPMQAQMSGAASLTPGVSGAAGGGPPPPAPGMLPPPPAVDPQQIIQAKAVEIFRQACQLLRDDKTRTFRIDIETDSTVEADKQASKEAVVEMFTAIGGFLEKALPIGQMMPQLAPALGQSILYAFRVFGAGRDVEGLWEQAIDQLSMEAKNPKPKPPSPEEVKAQAEIQKQQMENQRAAADFQMDQQRNAMDLQTAQQKNAMELERMQAELQIKREELNLKREELAMKQQQMQIDAAMKERETQINAAAMEHKAGLEAQAVERQAELSEVEHERGLEAAEHKHELGMEVMDAKAKQAKAKPKGEARA